MNTAFGFLMTTPPGAYIDIMSDLDGEHDPEGKHRKYRDEIADFLKNNPIGEIANVGRDEFIKMFKEMSVGELLEFFPKYLPRGRGSRLGVLTNCMKSAFNLTLGWTIPDKIIVDGIAEAYKKHAGGAKAKVVDYGSGVGLISHLLNIEGIPTISVDEKIINGRVFVKPRVVKNYIVNPKDILLISWGLDKDTHESDHFYNVVQKYIIDGGKCVIIIGEVESGCTFPADYFSANKHRRRKWDTTSYEILNFYTVHTFMTVNHRR